MNRILFAGTALSLLIGLTGAQVRSIENHNYRLKIKAKDKFERSALAYEVAIEGVGTDYVIAYGSEEDRNRLKSQGILLESLDLDALKGFPSRDRDYHTYHELTDEMSELAKKYPTQVKLLNIGKSSEGRDLVGLVITSDILHTGAKPAVLLLGGHHAREHLSVEVPFLFARWYLEQANGGNERVQKLLETRELHILPAVNPDGLEYDISGGIYHLWRKNRNLNPNGTYGVDLNRNFGHAWGTTGTSHHPGSEVFSGPSAFSESESQAVKNYLDHNKISALISYHTFSEMILYPWGNVDSPIQDKRDRQVFETLARKMSKWNHYRPQQSADMYEASGDMVDWAYDAHQVFGFTFELDPGENADDIEGFYPSAATIQPVLQKNIEPCLYLLEIADDPYRVLGQSL